MHTRSGSVDKKIRETIFKGLEYLFSEQQKNGSFLSLSSNNQGFVNAKTTHTTFITSLILSALHTAFETKYSTLCKMKAIKFLLKQKNEDWSWNYWDRNAKESKEFPYPDDLDDTFCALSALYNYDESLIEGSVLAKVVMLLTAVEKKEGGPYCTWLVASHMPKVWRDVDIAVNSNIAYFLSLNNISLPKLDFYIDRQIDKNNLLSPYYATSFSTIYFLARFYKGTKKNYLKKVLLESREKNGKWNNPLDTALAVTSLLHLGVAPAEVYKSIEYILQSSTNGQWKAYPFIKERVYKSEIVYSGAPSLTTAFCIEALGAYEQALQNSAHGYGLILQEKEQMVTIIVQQVVERFVSFEPYIQQKVKNLIDSIITKDASKQIPLVSFYFASGLKKTYQKEIDKSSLVKLGTANVFGWMAYTIIDDFLDEEATDPQMLSIATVALREAVLLFSSIDKENSQFPKYLSFLLDSIDKANAWELSHCRFNVKETTIEKLKLPDFKDLKIIAEKSLGHGLGPISILYTLGTKVSVNEIQYLEAFFIHFLIAKQLNDDAHDWDKDLQKGQINPVNALLLRKWKLKNSTIHKKIIATILPELKEFYWQFIVDDISQIITHHLFQAEESLSAMTICENKNFLKSFLIPIHNATEQAIKERNSMLVFLKTYHE